MLHFFRKIRRDLLANSQFFKYLKYAVGEIVLVVLGILIALYINNSNEIRKEQERFDLILVEVEKELINNLQWSRFLINEFTEIDSLGLSLLIDSVKLDNQSKYEEIFGGIYVDQIEDISIRKVEQFNRLTIQQDSIKNQLVNLNTRGRMYLDTYSDNIIKLHEEQLDKIRNYDWYKSYFLQTIDERALQFFLNDPEFEKMIIDKINLINGFRNSLHIYDVLGHSVYNRIHQYLGDKGVQHLDSLQFQNDPKDYKHYLGMYESKWSIQQEYVHDDSIAVTLEDGKIIWNGYRSNDQGSRKEIIPINENYFRDEYGGFYYLRFDALGNVVGLRYRYMHFIIDIAKIR